jgi:peptidoglycan hydrolase CwlO-like protein
MIDRIITGILVTISALTTFVAVLCYSRISDYDSQIKAVSKRVDENTNKWNNLNEEDMVLLRKFDLVDKRFNEVDQKIKVNDIRITEIGAKVSRKK